MYTLLLFLFLIVCVLMTVTILLQSSKGGGLAGAFGGGGGQMGAVFGGRGAASFLSKLTTVLAAIYLLFSFALSKLEATSSEPESLVAKQREEISQGPASLVPSIDPSLSVPATDDAGSAVPATQDTSK